MEIQISHAAGQPIYEQICAQLREQILTGKLPPDTLLPSIRSLAKDLRISVITTKRAYEELEQEGLLYTAAGKGCFVARADRECIREEKLRQLEELLRQAVPLAAACGLPDDEVADLYRALKEEH